MSFIRKIKRGNAVYPAEVENVRVDGIGIFFLGHTYVLRTDLKGTTHQAFWAAGIRQPSSVTMIG